MPSFAWPTFWTARPILHSSRYCRSCVLWNISQDDLSLSYVGGSCPHAAIFQHLQATLTGVSPRHQQPLLQSLVQPWILPHWMVSHTCTRHVMHAVSCDACMRHVMHHWYYNATLSVCRIFTIYTRSLPLDIACRVWDMFCRDGDSFLFRTALGTDCMPVQKKNVIISFIISGILKLYCSDLLKLNSIEDLGHFLSKLPSSMDSEALFAQIGSIHFTVRYFKQILSQEQSKPAL